MGDLVEASYVLGLASEDDLAALRTKCTDCASDLVDVIDGLVWIVREEWAEDSRARAKALRNSLGVTVNSVN